MATKKSEKKSEKATGTKLPSAKSSAPPTPKKTPPVAPPLVSREEKDALRAKKIKGLADAARKEGNDAAADKLMAAYDAIKAK